DPDKVAQAYAQFLIGRHLGESDLPLVKKPDVDGAIAAYKRAIDLDPGSADATAELAALYLRQNNIQEAMTTAELALKIAPGNPEANGVMGLVYAYAALAAANRDGPRRSRGTAGTADENAAQAIHHLEI